MNVVYAKNFTETIQMVKSACSIFYDISNLISQNNCQIFITRKQSLSRQSVAKLALLLGATTVWPNAVFRHLLRFK